MGFSQSVSGMNASSKQLDVIGNNIANSSTVGFKTGNVSFADMYAGTKIGSGVRVADVVQNFNDGTATSTERELDVAIAGNGFFRLLDVDNNEIYYTRNGEFQLNSDRDIVSIDGFKLTGHVASGVPARVQPGSAPQPLRVPQDMINATATTEGSLQVNLNSKAVVPTDELDPANPDTYNYSTTITSYDILGNPRDLHMYYVKTEDSNWDVFYMDTSDPNATMTKAGHMEFDDSGTLISDPKMNFFVNGLNGGADNEFTLSFEKSTQQNLGREAGNTKTPIIDGYKAGELVGFKIEKDGKIYGSYSNQENILLGQIVMSDFANLNGLAPAGGNNWQANRKSGQAVLGIAGTGTFGVLSSRTLESSNVDMSRELVNMIIAQRSYQSNSQSIKTQDQILNTLVNLR